MKIAIMTQPLGSNYGGIMQAWALQQVLKRMGHEPVTIDRQPVAQSAAYKLARLGYRTALKTLGKRKGPINLERYLPRILQHTQEFVDQHITMSVPLDSTKKLKEHFDHINYDAVIVGSDQTWRPSYSPNIYNFFLDFLEDKKIQRIAYASSFGIDQWEFNEEQTQKCAELAKKFDFISVREESGIDLCRKHLGVDATHALDPTLLLDKKDYVDLIGQARLSKKPEGIYTYFLDKSPEKIAFAQRAEKELNELAYSCQAKCSLNYHASNNISDYIMPDIKDWIAGFANAKLVLTDSFHGMVFSIIFGKPFFAIINDDRGAARFFSTANSFGLKQRILDSKQITESNIYFNKDNPTPITAQNTSLTNQSKELLIKNLLKHGETFKSQGTQSLSRETNKASLQEP